MARKLGYGGIANTNGARNFANKEGAVIINFEVVFIGSGLDSGGLRKRKRELLWWAFVRTNLRRLIYA